MQPGDRKELESRVRAHTTPQRRVERARIGLGSAEGLSGRALAREIGVPLPTVQRWLDRYDDEGLPGLEDRPPARPPVKQHHARARGRGHAPHTLEEKPPRGTHWSTRLMAECMGIHHSQVRRIWKAHGLKPHRVRYFKLSTDPRFVEKLRDVAGLYVAPPERAIVFSFDEKSQIQALWTGPSQDFRSRRGGRAP